MNSFEAWKIEEELEKLKAQMHNPQAQVNFPNPKYTPLKIRMKQKEN